LNVSVAIEILLQNDKSTLFNTVYEKATKISTPDLYI
jgi:hypothetical protein